MQKVIKFKADDGRIFSSREECLDYEKMARKMKRIAKPLGPRPDDVEFSNGGGYIQHSKEIITTARAELLSYFQKKYPSIKNIAYNWLGRHLDDTGNAPAYALHYRLSCIDSSWREWGQGYYAIHPSKGKQEPYKFKE